MIRRALLLLMTVLVSANFVSCGQSEEKTLSSDIVREDGIRSFRAEPVVLDSGSSEVYLAAKTGESAVLCANSKTGTKLFRLDLADMIAEPIEIDEIGLVSAVDGHSDRTALITHVKNDGAVCVSLLRDDDTVTQIQFSLPAELADSYILDVRRASEDSFLIRDYTGIYHALSDGTILNSYSGLQEHAELVRDGGDRLIIVEGGHKLHFLDEDMEIAESLELGQAFDAFFDGNTEEGNLIAYANNSVLSLDIKTGKATVLADEDKSWGISQNYIYLDGASALSVMNGSAVLWTEKDSDETIVLTLATCSGQSEIYDTRLANSVRMFNSVDCGYFIEIKDYAQLYGNEAALRLNAELAAGTYPDIFDVMSLEAPNYARNGLVQDLYEFIDKDPDVQRDDYFESILKTLENDGRLFEIVPKFSLTTVYTWAENSSGWNDIRAETPAEEIFGEGLNREEFIKRALVYSGDDFIDLQRGSCNFTDGRFKQLLEFSAQLEETTEIADELSAVYNGRQLYYVSSSSDPVADWQYANAVFHGRAKATAFPTRTGEGELISPDLRLAMCSKGINKDGVWEFFKYLLSDAYQWSVDGLSLRRDITEDYISFQISDRQTTEIKLGVFVKDNGSTVSVALDLNAPPAELRDEILDRLDKIDSINQYDTTIMNIILQEAEQYFEGYRTADEAVALIQSRVSICLAERYQ